MKNIATSSVYSTIPQFKKIDGVKVRGISSFFTSLFIVFTMLGTIKIYIGSNLNWLIQLMILMIATVSSLVASPLPLSQALLERLSLLRGYIPVIIEDA